MITLLLRVFSVDHRRHVAGLLIAATACLFGGAALFSATQHVGLGVAVYWAVTTATTVGYGDVTPHNGAGEIIASATMLTTIPLLAAVFALLTGAAAANGIRRILGMRHQLPESGYRLVIGTDAAVPAILEELVRADQHVVLVADVDPASVHPRVHVVRGDPSQPGVLSAARPADAIQALISGATDGDVLVSAVLLRKLAPDLPVVALVRSASVREALADLGIGQTISASTLLAHTLAKSLEAPHAADMLTELVESDRHSLTEIPAATDAIGRPLSAIRDEREGLVLGLVHDGRFLLGIGEDPVLAPGDSLLLAEPAPTSVRRH
jgi:voltage-gated potassium channel